MYHQVWDVLSGLLAGRPRRARRASSSLRTGEAALIVTARERVPRRRAPRAVPVGVGRAQVSRKLPLGRSSLALVALPVLKPGARVLRKHFEPRCLRTDSTADTIGWGAHNQIQPAIAAMATVYCVLVPLTTTRCQTSPTKLIADAKTKKRLVTRGKLRLEKRATEKMRYGRGGLRSLHATHVGSDAGGCVLHASEIPGAAARSRRLHLLHGREQKVVPRKNISENDTSEALPRNEHLISTFQAAF